MLRTQSSTYVGLDVDDYEACYYDIPNARIITYDGRNFPLEERSVDLVVSHSVLEHVLDAPAVFDQIQKVLKVGGLAFLSINPLYYSSWGSHGTLADNVTRLSPWEHLDPSSPHYLTAFPPQLATSGSKGCHLNKITMSDILAEVGRRPWSVVRLDRRYEDIPLPPFLAGSGISETDLRNHDFRILIRKDR